MSASKFLMNSGDIQPQSESGQIVSEGRDVLRRNEFDFDPFIASLIQLPESRTRTDGDTKFFSTYPPLPEIATASTHPEFGEDVAYDSSTENPQSVERKSDPSQVATPPPASFQEDITPEATIRERNPLTKPHRAKDRSPKLQARARFYQPETVRFFDPVGAAAEDGGEGANPAEQMGPRPSTQLSAELKAAIWQIDEQFRQRQKEQKEKEREKPATEIKRGFLASRLVQKSPSTGIRSHSPKPEAPPATRSPRWKRVEARLAAALGSPKLQLRKAVVAPLPERVHPSMLGSLEKNPATAERQTALRVEEQVPVEQLAPRTIEDASTAAKNLQTGPVQATALVTSASESLPPAKRNRAMAVDCDLIADQLASPVIPAPAAEQVSTQAVDIRTHAAELIAPVTSKAAVVAKPARGTKKSAKAKQTAAPPKPQVDERVRAKSVALSQVRLADLRAQRDSLLRAQVPVAEVSPEIAERPLKKIEKEKPSLTMRLQKWLAGDAEPKVEPVNDGNRRGGERKTLPGLVVFYYNGGTPRPREVLNISTTGFYLHTDQFWSVDTMVKMTLQRPSLVKAGKSESISVLARVVRIDEGGVAHEFVTTGSLDSKIWRPEVRPDQETDRLELSQFLGAGDAVVGATSLPYFKQP
ncbi:hypothetical protein P8935_18770 [Telmatobacter sp. DSM 110680]|uniref:PilZ domain-containing protein n=1 Tax=Telmatobacter sp. DSM 110680 TaxID=3036704 RepID=A0AAU7DIK3_9BACT